MAKASDMMMPQHAADVMGTGSAELTIRMRKAYDDANMQMQTNGQVAPSWAAWLGSQGYGVDNKGLVFKAK